METLKKLGNWALILSFPPSLYEQYCIKSNMSAGWCFNICYCWNKMTRLFFPSLHSSNICMCRSVLYIFIPSNTAPLQGKGIKGKGILPLVWRGFCISLPCVRPWVSGCGMTRHGSGALRCACVQQRSSQPVCLLKYHCHIMWLNLC